MASREDDIIAFAKSLGAKARPTEPPEEGIVSYAKSLGATVPTPSLPPEELQQISQNISQTTPIQRPEVLAPQPTTPVPPARQVPLAGTPTPMTTPQEQMAWLGNLISQSVPGKIIGRLGQQAYQTGPAQLVGALQNIIQGVKRPEFQQQIKTDPLGYLNKQVSGALAEIGRPENVGPTTKSLAMFIPQTAYNLVTNPKKQVMEDPLGTIFLFSLAAGLAGRGIFDLSVDRFARKARAAGWPDEVIKPYMEAVEKVAKPEGLVKEVKRFIDIQTAEIPGPKARGLEQPPTAGLPGPARPVEPTPAPEVPLVEPTSLKATERPSLGVTKPATKPEPELLPPITQFPKEAMDAVELLSAQRLSTEQIADKLWKKYQLTTLDITKIKQQRGIPNEFNLQKKPLKVTPNPEFEKWLEARNATPEVPGAMTMRLRKKMKVTPSAWKARPIHWTEEEQALGYRRGLAATEEKPVNVGIRGVVPPEKPVKIITEPPEALLAQEDKVLGVESRILNKTGHPEEAIKEYVENKFWDGEKLREVSKKVMAGEITEDQAVADIKGDLDNMTAKPIEQKLPPIEKVTKPVTKWQIDESNWGSEPVAWVGEKKRPNAFVEKWNTTKGINYKAFKRDIYERPTHLGNFNSLQEAQAKIEQKPTLPVTPSEEFSFATRPGTIKPQTPEQLAGKQVVAEIKKGTQFYKHLEDLSKEVKRKTEGEGEPTIGLTVKRVVPTGPEPKFTFADKDIEDRFQAAKGVPTEKLPERVKQLLVSLKNKLTRTYEHLPIGARFIEAKQALKQLSKQRPIAADHALRTMQGITIDLDKANQDLFRRKVILDDLNKELNAEHDLPFGFNKENLPPEVERLNVEVEKNPTVKAAIDKRNKAWEAIKDDYIYWMKKAGRDIEKKMDKVDYFRHQVLEYARAKGVAGTGRRLKTPISRGFLKERKGSEFDINTDYFEAEFEVMGQMLYDIEVNKTLDILKDNYDIKNSLKTQALQENDARIMPYFEKLADEWNRNMAATGKDYTPKEAYDMYRQTLNWKQAMGFEELGKLAADGKLPDTPDAQFNDLIEAMADCWIETKQVKKELGKDFTAADVVQMDEELYPQLFRYMAWVLKENAKTEAAGAAGTVFKGMREKREYIKKKLGKDYVEYDNLIPDKYVSWQPIPGNVFYFSETVPEKLARMIMEEGSAQIMKEDLKKALTMGGKRQDWIIPKELGLTLDGLIPEPPKWMSRFSAKILGSWKAWVLSMPKRAFKFNMRNLSGDADAVFVGNPKGFKQVPAAIKELYDVFVLKKPMTGEMAEWFNRGGMESTLQAQELKDIKYLSVFRKFYGEEPALQKINVLKKYWKLARGGADFREAILRYANYRSYLEQMQKNERGRPSNFGASIPDEIMGLHDIRDRAFRLSNELLGPYDEISEFGQTLRRHIYPFWSWKELNARRYYRLLKNAGHSQRTKEKFAGKAFAGIKMTPYVASRLGAFLLKATALWTLVQVYNNLLHPDEEKDLPENVRSRLHIILGRDKMGKVRAFTRIGALGDFLEWFGLDAAPDVISSLLSGKKSLKEVGMSILKSPISILMSGVSPFLKTPFELVTRQELYPDVFNPRVIRDRGIYLARQLDLDEEYKAIAGIPQGKYSETVGSIFYYSYDPLESAYHEINSLKRDYLKQFGTVGQGFDLTPRGNALYNWKLAIRYGDKQAEKKYADEYEKYHLLEFGATPKSKKEIAEGIWSGIKTSLLNMSPLAGMSKTQAIGFVEQLKPDEVQTLLKAIKFYNDVLLGRSNITERDLEER
jgi:hypothetical protein